MNKYELASRLYRQIEQPNASVIDIGCRDGILKEYISFSQYLGIDVDPDSVADKLLDIEKGTPFLDKGFDVAFALDVLEHTDNMYQALKEIVRISRFSIIALPNLYSIGSRIKFLFGRPISGKYGLSKKLSLSGGLRHRWLFTPDQADSFIDEVGDELGLRVTKERLIVAQGKIVTPFQPLLPSNLKATSLMYLLER